MNILDSILHWVFTLGLEVFLIVELIYALQEDSANLLVIGLYVIGIVSIPIILIKWPRGRF